MLCSVLTEYRGCCDCVDRVPSMLCSVLTEYRACLPQQFRCASGHCVSEDFVCDGDKDCQDTSDEMNCTTRYPDGRFCPANKFQCDNSVSLSYIHELRNIRYLIFSRIYIHDHWKMLPNFISGTIAGRVFSPTRQPVRCSSHPNMPFFSNSEFIRVYFPRGEALNYKTSEYLIAVFGHYYYRYYRYCKMTIECARVRRSASRASGAATGMTTAGTARTRPRRCATRSPVPRRPASAATTSSASSAGASATRWTTAETAPTRTTTNCVRF